MTNERDDGEFEPPGIDWALGERLGGERPPDLRAAVRGKLVRGTRSPRPQRVLQAALMLLGLAAVLGVAFWPKQASAPTPIVAPLTQEPQPVQVSSLADVAALPAGTRAVAAIGVGDAVIEALTRLHEIEVLTVREPWNESYGLGLKTTPPASPEHITHASWRQFAKFTKLRRLELSGTVMLGQVDKDGVARSLALLESLPLLESLTLRCFDARPELLAQLPRLPNLRRLDLSFNHGFLADGVESVLQCRLLRSLSLRGCQQLQGDWLARLHQLAELEELDLGLIDGMNWRSGPSFLDDTEQQVIRRAAGSRTAGVTDLALAGLAKAPKLRVLDICSGPWSGKGLAELGRCTTLRELNMFGGQERGPDFVADLPPDLERLEVCGDFTDGFCMAVREHLPKLRHLCVAACYLITDRGLGELCAMPSLRVLDMRQMRGLTAASAATIGKAVQLEELDLRHNDWLTVAHVLLLRGALPKLRSLQTNFTPEQLAAASRPPTPVEVHSRAELDALPVDTRSVLGTDLDDAAMAGFARLRGLEELAIVAAWASPGARKFSPEVRSITDAGLRQLAGSPALRSLRLCGQLAVKGPGLEVLAQLPALEGLELELMKVDDVALSGIAALPGLRTVRFPYLQGFGTRTMDALAKLSRLRVLSLHGCVHVEDEWLMRVAALPQLVELDLGMIGSRTFFSGLSAPLEPVEPGSGVTDRVLERLGAATKLSHLNLEHAGIAGSALRHLQGLPQLRSLDLRGTSITGADLQWLPAGIEVLDLGNCAQLGQDFGAVLAKASPRLHTLRLVYGRELTDECLDALRGVRSLRQLDLSHPQRFTAAAIGRLTALDQLEELTAINWQEFGEAEWARVRAMPNLKRLTTNTGTEQLR